METLVLVLCACALNSLAVIGQHDEENKIPVVEIQPEHPTDTLPRTIENQFRRSLSMLPGRRLGRLRNSDDLHALRQAFMSQEKHPVTLPSAPASPECFVEIKVTQRVPGRCTRLGSHHLPACQAQDLLSMDYEDCGDGEESRKR